MSKERTVVVISPDKDTDYIYLDMSREEAIAEFKENEDWHNIYASQNLDFSKCVRVEEIESNFFMLWRGAGKAFREQEEAMFKKYFGEE